MSVSRVEYDAALTRTLQAVSPCRYDGPCEGACFCKHITLAALGLDEPPTEDEAPVRYTPAEHAEHFGYPLVVPPSEPPKACPTCGDDLTDRDRAGHMWDEHGSGIDGGTAA